MYNDYNTWNIFETVTNYVNVALFLLQSLFICGAMIDGAETLVMTPIPSRGDSPLLRPLEGAEQDAFGLDDMPMRMEYKVQKHELNINFICNNFCIHN